MSLVSLVIVTGMLVVIGLLLLAAAPSTSHRVARRLVAAPIESAARGVALLALSSVAAGLLALTVIGVPLAIALAGVVALALLLGGFVVAVVVGAAVPMEVLAGRRTSRFLLGCGALALVAAVPWVGPALIVALGATGAGALASELVARSTPRLPVAV